VTACQTHIDYRPFTRLWVKCVARGSRGPEVTWEMPVEDRDLREPLKLGPSRRVFAKARLLPANTK